MAVEVTHQHLVHFEVPLFEEYNWRYTGNGIWKPESKRTEEEQEHGPNDLQFADNIFTDILYALLGEDNGFVEFITGGPSIIMIIDVDECSYSVPGIRSAMGLLYEHMNSGQSLKTDRAPYTHNRGTEEYHDPVRIYPNAYLCPRAVKKALGKPRTKTEMKHASA